MRRSQDPGHHQAGLESNARAGGECEEGFGYGDTITSGEYEIKGKKIPSELV